MPMVATLLVYTTLFTRRLAGGRKDVAGALDIGPVQSLGSGAPSR